MTVFDDDDIINLRLAFLEMSFPESVLRIHNNILYIKYANIHGSTHSLGNSFLVILRERSGERVRRLLRRAILSYEYYIPSLSETSKIASTH